MMPIGAKIGVNTTNNAANSAAMGQVAKMIIAPRLPLRRDALYHRA